MFLYQLSLCLLCLLFIFQSRHIQKNKKRRFVFHEYALEDVDDKKKDDEDEDEDEDEDDEDEDDEDDARQSI